MTPTVYDRRALLRLGAGGLAGLVAAPTLANQPASAATAPPIAFGVNQHLTAKGTSPQILREQMRLMKLLGATVSRNALKWKQVEKKQGHYNWSAPDQAADLCHGAGVKMMWTVGGPAPGWFQPGIPSSSNADQWKAWLDGYTAFVDAAAQRYGQVPYWELWNEANLRKYWNSDNTERANAHDYKLWYQAIRQALRARLPKARIAVGGLTNATLGNANQPSGQSFLGTLLAAPAAPVERVAVHIYCRDAHSPDSRISGGNNFLDFEIYRKQLLRARHGDSKLWITEWGWPTGAGGVTPAVQARYVGRSLDRIAHDWEHSVEVATIFIDYDRPNLHFGLFGPPPSFTPKPAAAVFRKFVDAYRARHKG